MKRKIILTILLFLFSIIYLYNGIHFIRENDTLMQEIKKQAENYYQKPIDAFITDKIMIPEVLGKKVNLKKSYQKMKKVNSFQQSMLVLDDIKPKKTIENHYDKIIISGNQNNKKISLIFDIENEYLFSVINKICISQNIYADILTNQKYHLDETNFVNMVNTTYYPFINYCITNQLNLNSSCLMHHKYTFFVHSINNYFLTQTKDQLHNGFIYLLQFNEKNYQELTIILKYLKNNHYEILPLNKLLTN